MTLEQIDDTHPFKIELVRIIDERIERALANYPAIGNAQVSMTSGPTMIPPTMFYDTPTGKLQILKAITDKYPLPWTVDSGISYPAIKDANGRIILTTDENTEIEADLLKLIKELGESKK